MLTPIPRLTQAGIIFFILLAIVSSIPGVGLRGTEPRRAFNAIETLETGSYIVHRAHGLPYYNKPPVYSWVLAGSIALFGSASEIVVRLPGLLSLLGMALILYLVLKQYGNRRMAFMGVCFFLTFADLLVYGSVYAGEIDLFYSLIILLQGLSMFWFMERKQYLRLFAFSYMLAAIGLLTKGIPSIAFQGIGIVLTCMLFKNLKLLFSWRHVVGILIFLAISGGYFYAYAMDANIQGFLVNLFKESSQRSANEASVLHIIQHFIVFPLKLMGIMAPWALFGLFIFRKEHRKALLSNSLVRFAAWFTLANIVIYWVSPGEENRYLYTFFPYCAMVFAFLADQTSESQTTMKRAIEIAFGAGLAMVAVGFLLYPWFGNFRQFVDSPVLTGGFFGIVFMCCLYFFIRRPGQRLWILIFAMAVARMAFNVAILPYYHNYTKSDEFRGYASDIADIIEDEPIAWTGIPDTINPDMRILGIELAEVELLVAPELNFKTAYHVYRLTGQVLLYESDMRRGKFYLANAEDIVADRISEQYRFFDDWQKKEVVLFKLE